MHPGSKTTPLHDWHAARGAKMADFGGYAMPLWYTSARDEHLAVITAAGLFDTSHMAVVMLEGPQATALLQRCFTQDLEAGKGPQRKPLSVGRCVYGAYLDEQGGVIDDTIVNRLGSESYMLVVNASMGAAVAAHLARNAGALAVTVTDLSDGVGKIDVQGPAAAKILARMLADPAAVLQGLSYFSFRGHFDPSAGAGVMLNDGTPILLSRTGYTGEFGFELFVQPSRLVWLWETALAAGKPFGAIPCGLAARDSLRAGAMMPLSHQDIGRWPYINHPWSFALPYTADGKGFTKEFIGAQALLSAPHAPHTLAFAGFDLRKVSLPAMVTDMAGSEIGTVLTCVTDMAVGRVSGRITSIASPNRPGDFSPKGLSCGFVKVRHALPYGSRVILADARRRIEVEIVRDVRPDRTARRPMQQML